MIQKRKKNNDDYVWSGEESNMDQIFSKFETLNRGRPQWWIFERRFHVDKYSFR